MIIRNQFITTLVSCIAAPLIALGQEARAGRLFVDCEPAFSETTLKPDLDSIPIDYSNETLAGLKRFKIDPLQVSTSIRHALRHPLPLPWYQRPRFLLFLPLSTTEGLNKRVEFLFTPETNRLLVTHFSNFSVLRDLDLFEDTQRKMPLRHLPITLRATDAGLHRAKVAGLNWRQIAEVFIDPPAVALASLSRPGEFWFIGKTLRGETLSIHFRNDDGLRYITGVEPATPQGRRTFFTQIGFRVETPEDRAIEVIRGRFAGRRVAYGIGIYNKIHHLHGLTTVKLRAALERAPTPLLTYQAPHAKGDDSIRERFVSEISPGEYVKVVVVTRGSELTIVSAYAVNQAKFESFRRELAECLVRTPHDAVHAL